MEAKNYDIDYSFKRAIFRILILIFCFLILYYFFNSLIFNGEGEEEIFYENSFGEFFSLSQNVKIQGFVEIDLSQNKIFFKNFKITNNENLVLKICDEFCYEEIFITKLKSNVGNLEFEIEEEIEIEKYFKFVFLDEKKNSKLAFFLINENLN